MAELDIAERRVPQDGRVGLTVDGRHVDLRVVTLPTVHGETIVMRILDKDAVVMKLDKLGMGDEERERFQRAFHQTHGAVLVTGPTGSGKSTTLYAALQQLNTPEKNIITVEDPVEYQLEGITQVQVYPKAGLTFATGLRAIVRADPDVIMVGEIRDRETAQIAVESALTGHLVLSTLHTNDAPAADHPPDRDGHRAVPRRLRAGLRARPAPRAHAVLAVQAAHDHLRGDAARERLHGARGRRGVRARSAASAAAARATAGAPASTR